MLLSQFAEFPVGGRVRAIIVFGSFVGNTETLAGYIKRGLEQAGHTVTCKDVVYASTEELLDYELILLGSPTYEPKMIQDDMLGFFERLKSMSLAGYKAAAFGPGDTAWPDFCEAVKMLDEQLRHCGAEIVADMYTVDGIVEEAEKEAIAWGSSIR
jgi:flavodoxin I